MMRNILLGVIILHLFVFSSYAAKAVASVEIQADANYDQIAEAIRKKVTPSKKYSIVVTVGKASLAKALSNMKKDTRLVALFITEADFAVATYQISDRLNVSGLFLGVDPRVPIAATRALTPDSTILIPITKETRINITTNFINFANSNRAQLKSFETGDTKAVYAEMSESRTLIVYPDKSILNESTITPLLSSLYRKQKFTVGWTEDQVKKGALLAAVFNENKYAVESVEFVKKVEKGEYIEPKFSSAFDIKINQYLYRALAISPELITSEQLEEDIKKRLMD